MIFIGKSIRFVALPLLCCVGSISAFSQLYYKNGQVAWQGLNAYYESGKNAFIPPAIYYENQQRVLSGATVYYEGGKTAWNGSSLYYDDGNIAWNVGGLAYHRNRKTAFTGTDAYYDNGTKALSNIVTNFDEQQLAAIPLSELALSAEVSILIKISSGKVFFCGLKFSLTESHKFVFDYENKQVENHINLGRDIFVQIVSPRNAPVRTAALYVLGVKVL
ncbi:hypothetical protein [Emticicia sp. 17c]|uniref:hypothetical protein n=1 Tax=Emticicia sp. 17c TaxID=3127704 RepID=UPI00301CBE60